MPDAGPRQRFIWTPVGFNGIEPTERPESNGGGGGGSGSCTCDSAGQPQLPVDLS